MVEAREADSPPDLNIDSCTVIYHGIIDYNVNGTLDSVLNFQFHDSLESRYSWNIGFEPNNNRSEYRNDPFTEIGRWILRYIVCRESESVDPPVVCSWTNAE